MSYLIAVTRKWRSGAREMMNRKGRKKEEGDEMDRGGEERYREM